MTIVMKRYFGQIKNLFRRIFRQKNPPFCGKKFAQIILMIPDMSDKYTAVCTKIGIKRLNDSLKLLFVKTCSIDFFNRHAAVL